ncbi:MAG: hypothetical protein WCX81_03360 [Monoglobales bacterium]
MEDIRIYDANFNLLHIESNVISSNWTVYFNSVGTFEIHTLVDSVTAQTIIDNLNFDENKIPIIVQGDLQGIVTGVRLSEDFAIYGKTCNWLLSRKIVPKFITSDLPVPCNPEEVARHIVSNAFADQPDFILGERAELSDMDPFWRNTYNSLSEVVSDLLAKKYAGHNLYFDWKNKKWVFNIFQPGYTNIVLSEANRNASETEYTYSIDDYYSACFYEQEQYFADGEFPDPVWTKLVKDDKTGIFRCECVVEATVESEAESLLKGKTVKSEIVADICGLVPGEDFNLGDILRVQISKGKIARTKEKQVSGICFGWESGLSNYKVILNNL